MGNTLNVEHINFNKDIKKNESTLYLTIKENKKNISQIKNRNYGIDLARIILMINIIILHINLYSQHLSLNIKSLKYKPCWLLQSNSFCAVDAFGLISGIVGYKKYKFSNLIYLWFETCFYSMLFSIWLYFNYNTFHLKYLILSFFPILIKRHWYVNAYFSLYLLLPFVNYGINQLEQNIYKNIILFFILFYSFYDIINKIINNNVNYHFLNNGYNSMWLLILYIIGSYFGKYILFKKNKFSYFYYIFWIFVYSFFSILNVEIQIKLNKVKTKIPSNILINYLSPTVIIQAISLIFYFSNLNIRSKFIQNIISFFTPLNFNTTLIHIRFFQEKSFLKEKLFNWVKSFKHNYIFFKIYGLSIIIYIICSFIDYFRYLLFKILKIKELCILLTN